MAEGAADERMQEEVAKGDQVRTLLRLSSRENVSLAAGKPDKSFAVLLRESA